MFPVSTFRTTHHGKKLIPTFSTCNILLRTFRSKSCHSFHKPFCCDIVAQCIFQPFPAGSTTRHWALLCSSKAELMSAEILSAGRFYGPRSPARRQKR